MPEANWSAKKMAIPKNRIRDKVRRQSLLRNRTNTNTKTSGNQVTVLVDNQAKWSRDSDALPLSAKVSVRARDGMVSTVKIVKRRD